MKKVVLLFVLLLFVLPRISVATPWHEENVSNDMVCLVSKEKKKKEPKTMSSKQWEKKRKKDMKKGKKEGVIQPMAMPMRPSSGTPMTMNTKGRTMGYDQFIKQKGMQTVKSNFITLHKVNGKVYFEFPKKFLGREMLIAAVAKESSDPEIITAGYKPMTPLYITFELLDGAVYLSSVNSRIMVNPDEPKMKDVEKQHFMDPLKERFGIEAYNRDSSAVIFDVTSLFSGKESALNPVSKQVGSYSVQAPSQQNLSFIGDIKAFDDNLSVEACITYDITLSYSMVKAPIGNMTAKVVHSLLLLPEEKMKPRISDTRLGVFLTNKQYLGTEKDGLQQYSYANHWRVEPKDWEAWEKGELVEPVKPIVWYVDTLFPDNWIEPIKKAVLLWNKAFEQIGLKNVMQVREFPKNDPTFDPDNLKFSCIRYVPASVPNAMGPSWVDPSTGEIVTATVLVYNDFVRLINNWRFVQTAQVDSRVRTQKMPKDVLDESITYVISHEIGHTLGLMHNMAASAAFPVDSLRSASFTQKYGTTPSIMDYARFNYIVQPGDKGVKLTPPELGVYDYFIMKWLYSPIAGNLSVMEEAKILEKWVDEKAGDPLYRYGRQQTMSRYDPSALEEDLGDDAIKAGDYGIKNLKYILAHLHEWIENDPDFSHRSTLYGNIVNQYLRYISNVAYNVGGIYLTSVKEGTSGKPYEAVSRAKQQLAMKWVIRQMKNCDWVDDRDILDNVGLNIGMAANLRQSVLSLLMNLSANVVLSSYISKDPYTLSSYFNDLYNGVWEKTINGQRLTAGDRQLQRMLTEGLTGVVKSMVSGQGGGRRLSLADAYEPTLDEIILYGLDESGVMEKYADMFRQLKKDQTEKVLEHVSFGHGYGNQKPLDISVIDERAGFFVDMTSKIERLVKTRLTSANATDRAHYQSILLMIEGAKK